MFFKAFFIGHTQHAYRDAFSANWSKFLREDQSAKCEENPPVCWSQWPLFFPKFLTCLQIRDPQNHLKMILFRMNRWTPRKVGTLSFFFRRHIATHRRNFLIFGRQPLDYSWGTQQSELCRLLKIIYVDDSRCGYKFHTKPLKTIIISNISIYPVHSTLLFIYCTKSESLLRFSKTGTKWNWMVAAVAKPELTPCAKTSDVPEFQDDL